MVDDVTAVVQVEAEDCDARWCYIVPNGSFVSELTVTGVVNASCDDEMVVSDEMCAWDGVNV